MCASTMPGEWTITCASTMPGEWTITCTRPGEWTIICTCIDFVSVSTILRLDLFRTFLTRIIYYFHFSPLIIFFSASITFFIAEMMCKQLIFCVRAATRLIGDVIIYLKAEIVGRFQQHVNMYLYI
jgi:hypothetical protein